MICRNWPISLHSTMAAESTGSDFHVIPQEKYIRENMSPIQLRASHQLTSMISALERYSLAPYVQSVRSYDREDWTSGGIVDIIPHMEAYWAMKHFMYILKDIDLSGDVEEAKHYNILLMYYDECKVIIQRRGQPVLYKLTDVGDIISDGDVISLAPTAVAEDTSTCRLVYTPNRAAERRGASSTRLRSVTEDIDEVGTRQMSPDPQIENAIDVSEGDIRSDVSSRVSPTPRADGENDEWEDMEEESEHISSNTPVEDLSIGRGNPDLDDDLGQDDHDPIRSLASRLIYLHQQYNNKPTSDDLKEKLVAVVAPTPRPPSPDSDSPLSTPQLVEEEQSDEEDPEEMEILRAAINRALFNSRSRGDARRREFQYSDSDSE